MIISNVIHRVREKLFVLCDLAHASATYVGRLDLYLLYSSKHNALLACDPPTEWRAAASKSLLGYVTPP